MSALVLTACNKAEEPPADMPQAGTASGGAGGAAGTATGGAGGEGATEAGTTGGSTPETGGIGGAGAIGGAAGEAGTAGMEETGGMGGAGGTDITEDPRGACDLMDTGFLDDEACILPPAEGEGFQIHIGPADYTNAGDFAVPPGEENSRCVSFRTPNTEDVFYQGFVLSGRQGTHHIINTMYVQTQQINENTFETCLDGGTGTNGNIVANLPGASKKYMPRKAVAPENATLGRVIPADSPSQADMHYFNFTEDTLLREFWLNMYFIPESEVTDEATQIRGMGGFGWRIQPGTNKVYQYSCPITAPGRIISLLGHYHAHGERFSAFLKRGSGESERVFEMYDYNEPAEFAYDSISMNPAFAANTAAATTGMLEVAAGDTLQWECLINNDSNVALDYSNHVETGEMCNLWGASVGPKINCVLLGETPFVAPM